MCCVRLPAWARASCPAGSASRSSFRRLPGGSRAMAAAAGRHGRAAVHRRPHAPLAPPVAHGGPQGGSAALGLDACPADLRRWWGSGDRRHGAAAGPLPPGQPALGPGRGPWRGDRRPGRGRRGHPDGEARDLLARALSKRAGRLAAQDDPGRRRHRRGRRGRTPGRLATTGPRSAASRTCSAPTSRRASSTARPSPRWLSACPSAAWFAGLRVACAR